MLPPELLPWFDDAFVRSCDLVEEHVYRLALGAFRALGLEQACRTPMTVAEAVANAGLAPSVAQVPVSWLLRLLAARGAIDCTGTNERVGTNDRIGKIDHRSADDIRYCASRPLPELDAGATRSAQQANDPRCLPAFDIAELAAAHYPAVLRGETSGEEALFAPAGFNAWAEYFSNANPLYAISNIIGAIAVERALPDRGTVLEIGGGLGSATEAVFARLDATGRRDALKGYRFTELAPPFLRRAKRTLAPRLADGSITLGWLDIDKPLAEAGVAPGSYSLVYGVNVLHVARDLAATLRELRTALAPGGALVISECVRPFEAQPLYVESVFNLLEAFRQPSLHPEWRPNGGFLTPEQWSAALQANGFAQVSVYPDIASIRDAYPQFVAAAIVAVRS